MRHDKLLASEDLLNFVWLLHLQDYSRHGCTITKIIGDLTVFLCVLIIFKSDTFKQVAKTVTDVHLTDNVVDVVYKMFDENGN